MQINCGKLEGQALDWVLAAVVGVTLKEGTTPLVTEDGTPWNASSSWQYLMTHFDMLDGELYKRAPGRPIGHPIGEGNRLCKVGGIVAAGPDTKTSIGRALAISRFGQTVDVPADLIS